MKNKITLFFKSESWQYFEYAMLAFGGLGLEIIYAYFMEPFFYGHSMKDFTTAECIIHWSITIITWLAAAFLIVKNAGKKLGFQLKETDSRWTPAGIFAGCMLIGLTLVENYIDVGNIKIIHEFWKLGVLKFTFQHLYYLAEVVLFTLIIIFGQNSLEQLFRKKDIPYGGIIVGLTWGLAHLFTKGSMWVGLEGLITGFLFGAVYLFLGRNFWKTYLVLALAFII